MATLEFGRSRPIFRMSSGFISSCRAPTTRVGTRSSEVLPAVPVLERARDDELVRALHGVVDLRIEVLERARDRVGPGVEPADVAPVDLLEHHFLVLGRVVLALRLVLDEDGEDLGRQRRAQLLTYST